MADREVIVNNEGRSTGALVAGIVAVLLILIAIWYFANNGTTADEGGVNIDVTVPATTN